MSTSPIRTLIDAVCSGKWGQICALLTKPDPVITVQKKTIRDVWAEGDVSDGATPTFISQDNMNSVSATGGTGGNGVGRIYTVTFPAHPLGANYHVDITPFDDTQPDTATPEIISKTAATVSYQLPQGDDGGSEDDNDYFRHLISIGSEPCEVITAVLVDGVEAVLNE